MGLKTQYLGTFSPLLSLFMKPEGSHSILHQLRHRFDTSSVYSNDNND